MTSTSTKVLYWQDHNIFALNFTNYPPREEHIYGGGLSKVQHLCSFHDSANRKHLVIAKGNLGLHCYQMIDQCYRLQLQHSWEVKGQLYVSGQSIDAQRVVHGRQSLFVHDRGNRCVQMFDLHGVHIAVLVRDGEMGIRTIRNLLWCKATSSLLVGHGGSDQKYDFSKIELVPIADT